MTDRVREGRGAAPSWGHKAAWLVGIGLVLNAGVMLYTHLTGRAPELVLDGKAYGQALPGGGGQMLGARGIYMMPAQLGPSKFGLYLMDVDSETITVYSAEPERSRFRLMAARSFKNDRFLADYNNEKPTPAEVRKLVQEQRKREEEEKKTAEPTVEQKPKPDENKPDEIKPDVPK